MEKNKKSNILLQVVFFLNLAVFIACAIYIVLYIYEGYKSERGVDGLRDKMEEIEQSNGNEDDDKTEKSGNYTDEDMLEAYKELRAGDYPSLVGRIVIEDTPIDYYVMQTIDDPECFLYKDVLGNYNKEGTPFADYRSDLYKPSSNIIIYAHAMLNQHKFGSLKKYKSKDYYDEHKIIKFETMFESSCDYEIIAACYTQVYDEDDNESFKYYDYADIETEDKFNEYVKNIKEMACYDTGIEAKYGDRLITLSTCNKDKGLDEGRFIVVAKKVTE